MIVYKSPYLTITYEEKNSLFIMQWVTSPSDIVGFKNEMLLFTQYYKTYSPKFALWLQHNFSLTTDKQTNIWLENHVNNPCIKAGNQKCAFVVSKDVIAHISVINAVDNYQSNLNHKHFVSENTARQWFYQTSQETICNNGQKVTFEGIDTDGNMLIKIPPTNIKMVLKALNKHLKHDSFVAEHEKKYNSLTKREKEILSFVANGKTHAEISEKTYISTHTVSTHWRNIKHKLNIKKSVDALVFHHSFQQ